MYTAANLTRLMKRRRVPSSRSILAFPKVQGRIWTPSFLDEQREIYLFYWYFTTRRRIAFVLRKISLSYYRSEFGASVSSPRASMQLVLQATSRPFGVKSTPHFLRKIFPSSCALKSNSLSTKATDIVGRYLQMQTHGQNG